MSQGSHDFDDMAREFQRIEAPSPDLVRAVKKGRRKLRNGLVTSLVLGAITSSAGAYVLYRDRDAPAAVFAAMEIGFPLFLLGFSTYSQRNAWRAKSATVRGFLDLQLERCRDRLRKMRFVQWVTAPLVGFVAAFQVLMVQKHPALLSWHPAAVFGLATPYAIAAGVFAYATRKRGRLRRKEAVLMNELAELDDLRT